MHAIEIALTEIILQLGEPSQQPFFDDGRIGLSLHTLRMAAFRQVLFWKAGATALLSVLAITADARAASGLSENAQLEIGHLLQYVEESGCDFYRNGSRYDSSRAREHLERKLDFARKRAAITAEAFIDKIASASSFTGRPYRVRCGARELDAGQWLTQELARYRSALASPAAAVR